MTDTPSTVNLTTLKNHLKQCSNDELVNEITELFKRFPAVKEYYQLKLSSQKDTKVITKYKKIIEDEFFPARGYGKARLSIAKKAISEYKRIANDPIDIADLMLFYVEQGVKFTNTYGDIDEAFYTSMEGMYETCIQWILKYKIANHFQARCQQIVKQTTHIGWGFHDALSEMYHDAFSS
jgi:hypothetical protein